MSTQSFIPKDKMLVELGFVSESSTYGFLYVSQHGRLQDILNDGREFLPFENITGKMIMLAKGSITSIVEIMNITAVDSKFGIYHLLDVSPQDDMDVIEAAYRSLIRRCHPDLFVSDEYPPELRDQMNLITKNINARITQIRESRANKNGS